MERKWPLWVGKERDMTTVFITRELHMEYREWTLKSIDYAQSLFCVRSYGISGRRIPVDDIEE